MLQKNNFLFLLIVLCSFNLYANEVSFEFFDNNAEFVEEEDGLPIRGKISFDLGYQLGSPERWITVGPYSQLIFDYQHESGQYYSELTIRNNHAYKIKNDPASAQDRYELDSVVREAYWKKAFADFTLTIGKTIVTWGKADLLPVIDVVSPIDNASSLFAKPEEVKTGQNIIKFDWYKDSINEFNFIYVPWVSNNIQIETGHPYNTGSLVTSNVIKDNNGEWAFRWNQTHDKWELSIVAGDAHQRDPVLIDSEQTWIKNKVLGAGFNYSQDPLLWKLEALYVQDRPMQILSPTIDRKDKDSIKTVAGFDYAHQSYGNWTAEYSIEQPVNKDTAVVLGDGVNTMAISWSDTFLQDDLTANIVLMVVDEKIKNHIARAGVNYNLDDNWTITSQLSFINSADSSQTLEPLKNFDRFDLSLNYNFDLE